MAIQLVFDFDNTWAARLAPMIQYRADEMRGNDVVVALIDSLPSIDSIDDLSVKQKAKLVMLVDLLRHLMKFEGREAADQAQQIVIDDIVANFPLEVGDA